MYKIYNIAIFSKSKLLAYVTCDIVTKNIPQKAISLRSEDFGIKMDYDTKFVLKYVTMDENTPERHLIKYINKQ